MEGDIEVDNINIDDISIQDLMTECGEDQEEYCENDHKEFNNKHDIVHESKDHKKYYYTLLLLTGSLLLTQLIPLGDNTLLSIIIRCIFIILLFFLIK